MPLLRLKAASLHYGNLVLLDGVDFSIPGMKLDPYPFQLKMILNMYLSPSLINGDSTGLGKTVSAIGLMQHEKQRASPLPCD